jgi:hypothetical protein
VSDPVVSGIVTHLDRPSGNTNGFANFEASMGGKWLEVLLEITPGLKRAAIMFNPDTAPVSIYMPSFETAARSLKVVPIIAPVHSDAEIETILADDGFSWASGPRWCVFWSGRPSYGPAAVGLPVPASALGASPRRQAMPRARCAVSAQKPPRDRKPPI